MSKTLTAALARYVAVVVSAASAGCGADVTQPSTSGLAAYAWRPPELLAPICLPDGPNVRCSVRYHDWATGAFDDVTSLAIWSLSGSSPSNQPTTAASLAAPGFIVPRDGGNVAIEATYNQLRRKALYSFGMTPGRAVIVLAPQLWGSVVETLGRGPVAIVGATVEIVDGPYAGTTSTNTRGDYAFDFFPLGAPSTLRASKGGYQ